LAAVDARSVFVHIARLLSETSSAPSVLALLAEAAVDLTGARASAVFELTAQGRAGIVAYKELPESFAAWSDDGDAIGPELAENLRRAAGDAFARALALPLVSSGAIFGALVLLFGEGTPVSQADEDLARAFADLAASAMSKAAQHEHLTRTHAELRASQDTLMRTDKLRALGEMAAGVSHDLKNVVAPLSLHLQVAQRALAKDKKDDVKEAIAECQAIVRRATELLERLRDFSRQSPETRDDAVDLAGLAHEASEIAKPRMAARQGRINTIVEELGPTPAIPARSSEVVSALVNLIVNAIDAMPEGGTITVCTGAVERRAFASVTDEGPGMTDEVRERIFQPFFTTKGERGTGLGLAMVYACMQRHGGSVTVETAPAKGAKFTLWFPIPVAH
jgi:signal transduction histidine kinase